MTLVFPGLLQWIGYTLDCWDAIDPDVSGKRMNAIIKLCHVRACHDNVTVFLLPRPPHRNVHQDPDHTGFQILYV